tara:strand:+ start:3209 stop:3430 length:222 start_codon:yes stop_codon:yes gene_type:complete
MKKQEFIQVIQAAVKELDKEALSCMARALLSVAEQTGENYAFSCPNGSVKIEAIQNPPQHSIAQNNSNREPIH